MNKTIFIVLTFLLTACATTQTSSIQPGAEKVHPKTAYLVIHGGKSGDMDAHIQNGLQAHGVRVRTGPDIIKTPDADIIVKYSDQWRWDIAMYLQEVQINFFDAKSADLLATGRWENSAFHTFPGADEVVNGVLDEMFTKIKVTPWRYFGKLWMGDRGNIAA